MAIYVSDPEREIEIFGRYLVRGPIVARVRDLYSAAITASGTKLSVSDSNLLQFVVRHPYLLGLIDAGLAVTGKQSELRRRLYLAFSILEASPEYADVFLGKPRSLWYVFTVGYIGVRAVCKAVAGAVLVKVIAR